ncbi:MAG: hypothetical protein M0P14_02795 [Alkaliphilus sp.]|nr:hypothetical protein [Alkaliphilus sp.]
MKGNAAMMKNLQIEKTDQSDFYGTLFKLAIPGVPLAFLGSFVLRLPIEMVVLILVLEEITKTTFSVKRLKSSSWIRQVIK